MANPVCIIAGVGPGMGLALARRFARGGYTVALLARKAGELEKFCAQIASEGGTAHGFAVDLTDAAALADMLAQVSAQLGPAEVGIYNASLWRAVHPIAYAPELFASDLNLCVTGALVLTQAVTPAMRAAGKGSLLFTGGGLALHPEQGGGVIGLATGKAAMRALVLALAPVLAADGVACTTITVDGAIAPGTAFDPERIADRYWQVHQRERADWQAEVLFDGRG